MSLTFVKKAIQLKWSCQKLVKKSFLVVEMELLNYKRLLGGRLESNEFASPTFLLPVSGSSRWQVNEFNYIMTFLWMNILPFKMFSNLILIKIKISVKVHSVPKIDLKINVNIQCLTRGGLTVLWQLNYKNFEVMANSSDTVTSIAESND